MQKRKLERIVALVLVLLAVAVPVHAQKAPDRQEPEQKATERKAPEPLSAKWKEVVPRRKVYANPDSIEQIGKDAFRAVIISETLKDTRTIDTDEIRCGEHSARRIRVREAGKVAATSSRDLSFPKDPFVKIPVSPPNNSAEVKYRNVCAMAREKFRHA